MPLLSPLYHHLAAVAFCSLSLTLCRADTQSTAPQPTAPSTAVATFDRTTEFAPDSGPPPSVHIELPPPPDVSGPFKPTYDSLKAYECPKWYADAKFGIWAHWGPQGVAGMGDWYARHMYEEGDDDYFYSQQQYGPQSQWGYKDQIQLWKAEKFDPDQLMKLYKAAGAKYFVSMACHHDNFDLWNSKYQRWNAVKMGPHKDIVGLWEAAAHKEGLKFGVSEHMAVSYKWYSIAHAADMTGPYAGVPYDANDPQYADLYGPKPAKFWQPGAELWSEDGDPDWWKLVWYRRVWDLLSTYKPDYLYSDFGNVPFRHEYGWRLLANYYNQSLKLNHGKLNVVYTGKGDQEACFTRDYEAALAGGVRSEPWQTDTCIGAFFWKRGVHYRTSDTVIRLLTDVVSKNGNLLLSIPQRPDGTLEQPEIDLLHEMATWMSVNGEAIFGTRPFKIAGEGPTSIAGLQGTGLPYTSKDIRYTTKGNTLYAIVLGWPTEPVTMQALATGSPYVSGSINTVKLLGYDSAIPYRRSLTGLTVDFPATEFGRSAYVLKITGLSDIRFDDNTYPDFSGDYDLSATTATLHGQQIGLSNTSVQNWGDSSDYVSWENIKFVKAGDYLISTQAASPNGSSSVTVAIGSSSATVDIPQTSAWDNEQQSAPTSINVPVPGVYTISAKATNAQQWTPVNLSHLFIAPAPATGVEAANTLAP